MPAGDRIIVGVSVGALILQEGSEFNETQWGFDSGTRRWLTHPDTPKSAWPQRGDADSEWSRMYVTDVTPREEDSGLIELTATFRGIMRQMGSVMKQRVLPGADVSAFNIPALQSGDPVRLVAFVPRAQVIREYVTATGPTLSGVSDAASGGWIPTAPTYDLTFTPDPENPPTYIYGPIGWRLDDRSWEDVAGAIWLVRETVSYYHRIAT